MYDDRQSLSEYVLARYETKRSGAGWLIRCPFHDDRHESMYVTEDYAYCFTCGKGWNTKQFVSQTGGDASCVYQAPKIRKPKVYTRPKQDIVRVAHSVLMSNKKAMWYLVKERKLSTDILEKYQVGYIRPPIKKCKLPRFSFPAWDEEGRLTSVSYRQDPSLEYGDSYPESGKYITHPGSQICLYNLHMVPEYTWMVYAGGQIDALSLLQFGIPSVGVMGEGVFKPDWVDVIGSRKVLILLDNDEAGKLAARKIHERLENSVVVEWPKGLPNKYDINSAICDASFGLDKLTALLHSYKEKL